MTRKLLTVSVVADILDKPKQGTYEAIRKGLIPVVRIGRQIRVDAEILEAWIKNGGSSLSSNNDKK